jgi:hypothetical protein
MPAWGLFGLMVSSAERRAIALARSSALIERDRVIMIDANCRPPASGEAAGALPDVDQVAERGRRPVRRGFPFMRAVARF